MVSGSDISMSVYATTSLTIAAQKLKSSAQFEDGGCFRVERPREPLALAVLYAALSFPGVVPTRFQANLRHFAAVAILVPGLKACNDPYSRPPQ
jgi:hypothetical protein